MDYQFLSRTALFQGSEPDKVKEMMKCFYAREKHYRKGEIVLYMGDLVKDLGLVLSGSVTIERDDLLGNRSIFGHAGAGQIFAETYACVPEEPLMVNVVADEDTSILFLDIGRVLTTCPSACAFHALLIRNLLEVLAVKNLTMNEKLIHLTQRTTRDKLLSYLSVCSARAGEPEFEIPYNRQQLADYLSVDRSAMSAELSRLRAQGILVCKKNRFRLLGRPET